MLKESAVLYYFTYAYPFGLGEQWKKNELEVFCKYFDRIIVVPLTYDGNYIPKPLPSNVSAVEPVITKPFTKTDYLKFLIGIPFNKNIGAFVTEFFQERVFLSLSKFKDWFSVCFLVTKIYHHKVFRQLLAKKNNTTTLYFFWGTGLAYSLIGMDVKKFKKVVVRFHRIDLYEERHASRYIPFRKTQLRKLDLAAPISLQGKKYLEQKYPQIKFKCDVYRLGCKSAGLAKMSEDGVLRVVSCSSVSSVKRVHIISLALKLLTIHVKWTHIGDGPLRQEIERLNLELPSNIEVLFTGKTDPDKVLEKYADHHIDLFVNVSESEGVPVSIMEAFSAGIPVFATDVGGTREIVNEEVGLLLPATVTPEELANAIMEFYAMSWGTKNRMRQNCYESYLVNCNAERWADRMALALSENTSK